MKFYFSLLFSFCLLQNVPADTLRVATALRITQNIKIDGVLDEECWQQAQVITDLIQNRPLEGKPAIQKTEVRILYNNYAVYIGAMLYDTAPDSILKQLGKRDEANLNADDFYFRVDPYHKNQDAYLFGVNAGGVQFDLRFSDGTYDAVWNSAVKINDKGWIAEMEIPYSAIRFPKTKIQDWGMQLTRSVRRTREFDQWALVPSKASNAQLYWGTLKGISDIDPPLRLSLTPYFSTNYEKTPITNDDNTTSYEKSLSYNAGADIKYGIDERFTADLTLFPDFGQVQSDKKVKNLSYRETVYDENRPFFKEGVELFNKGNLFYSRRIGRRPKGYADVFDNLGDNQRVEENPSQVKLLNAAKISGRTDGGLGIGFFNAVTDNTYAVIRDSIGETHKILTEPLTNYNLLVLDHQLKNNSNIYFVNAGTMRSNGYDDANVTGAGASFSNKKNTFIAGAEGGVSQIFNKDTSENNTFKNTLGYRYKIGAEKLGGNFPFGLSRTEINTTYNTSDLGYQTIPGFVEWNGIFNFNLYKPYKFLRESYNNFNFRYATNYATGKTSVNEYRLNFFANLLSYNAFFFGGGFTPYRAYDYQESRTDGRVYHNFRYYYAYGGISTDYRKRVAIDITETVSNFLDVFKSEGYNTEFKLRLRWSDKLFTQYIFNFNFDPYNVGYADDMNDTIIFGGRIIHTYENILSINYIFKNNMFVNITGRHYWSTGKYRKYFTLDTDGELVDNNVYDVNNDFNFNVFNIDLIYEWRFAPGSILNVVYKKAIETNTDVTRISYGKNFNNVMDAPQLNNFSIKFLYYLDYLKLKKKTSS